MTFPTSTHVGRLYVESRHRPATQGGGGDIHDVMATPFGVRLLIGDVMGSGAPANRTGLAMLNAWRDLAFTEPSLAGIAVRLHALIARSQHPERFVTALLANFPSPDGAGQGGDEPAADAGSWAELVCCGHPPPMLLRGGSAAFVTPYAAPPLGLLDLADGVVPGQHDPGRRRGPAAPVHRRRLRGQGRGGPVLPAGAGHGRGSLLAAAPGAAGRRHRGGGSRGPAAAGRELLDALAARLEEHVGDRAVDDILLLLVTMRLPGGA